MARFEVTPLQDDLSFVARVRGARQAREDRGVGQEMSF